MASTPKSRDVIGELYTSLCGDPELPANVQWRIYEYAVRTKKPVLMARLLNLPSLDPELDIQMGGHTEARVRSAWIARRGRPIEDVLRVLGEVKDGLVFTAAAAVPGLPNEVYRRLAGDRKLGTAQALLGNVDVPSDAKRIAAVTFGRMHKGRSSYRSDGILKDLFTEQLGLLQYAVEETTSAALIAFAASQVALPEDQLIRLVDQVLAPQLADRTPNPGWEAVRNLSAATAALLGQRDMPGNRRVELHQMATDYLQAHRSSAGVNPKLIDDALSAGPKNLPGQSSSHLDAMLGAETAEEVAAAAEIALRSQDAELAMALACNRFTDANTVSKLLPFVPRETRGRIAYARAADLKVVATVVAHNAGGWDLFSDELLAATGRPGEALMEIVREYRATGKKLSARIGRSEYITPSVMGALPLTFTSTKGTMLARRAVGDLLTTALSTSGDWEMFETLGNNFDGPLENLLLACGYVSAPMGAGADTAETDSAPADADIANSVGDDGVIDPDGIATWSLF